MSSGEAAAPLAGKIVVVTGATSGIGLETSIKLANLGAELVLVGRDRAKGDAAVLAVNSRSTSGRTALLLCDFASQKQIRTLAADILARRSPIHVLVNNAGSVSAARQVTEDGIERTFAVNHLGPFLLTNLLLDVLKESAPARVVTVSSIAHRRGELGFDDLQFERGGYSTMRAYSRSKLANVLFTAELARRLEGSGVTANALHPGAVATNIWSHAPRYTRPLLALAKLLMLSPERGADPVVHLAASPELEHVSGAYFERWRKVAPSRLASDKAVAKRLWEVSAALVGL